MTFALGLILGLTVGGSLGLLTAAMCFAARRGHDSHDRHDSHGG